MASATTLDRPGAGGEDFAALLDATLGADTGFAGSVVTGKVIRIDDDVAVVDVGLKSEGRVPLREFAPQGQKPEVKPGDLIVIPRGTPHAGSRATTGRFRALAIKLPPQRPGDTVAAPAP